jgi:hypothetical protein
MAMIDLASSLLIELVGWTKATSHRVCWSWYAILVYNVQKQIFFLRSLINDCKQSVSQNCTSCDYVHGIYLITRNFQRDSQ